MADIVINPAIGKIDFFSVKGDNVTNTLKLTGNTLLVTGPLSASSISTGGGGAFVTSVQPTSNYLSKFTGNSTIANSLIYDNGTNVGIGTTTSAARLQINSTTSGATLLRTDGTSGTLFTVVDDLSDSLMSVNNSAGLPVLEVFADDRIVGGQYGKNDFVVINNKVGIGTNNPTAKLQVTSSVSTPSAAFLGGNVGVGTTSPGNNLVVYNGSGWAGTDLNGTSGGELRFLQSGTLKANIYASTSTALVINSGDATIFQIGASEKMRLTGANLGIGTSSPAAFLDIVGNGTHTILRNTSATSYTTLRLFNDQNSAVRALEIDYSGASYSGALITSGPTGESAAITTTGAYPLAFGTNNTARMTILSGGNVGIATSSPTAKLQVGTQMYGSAPDANYFVVGNENFSGPGPVGGISGYPTTANRNQVTASMFDVAGGWERGNGSHALLRVSAYDVINSTPALTVLNNGNVGMGTTTPISLLDVRSGYITAGSSASTNGSTILAGYYSNSAGILTVLGTEQSSGGPVLGYAVTPSTSATGAFLSSTTITIPRSAYTQDGGTHRWFTGPSQTVAIGSAVTTSEKMRLDTNGNLGIGTSSPSGLLDVRGSLGANGAAAGVSAYFVNNQVGATSATIYIGSSAGIDWKVGKNVTGISNNNNFSIVDSNNNRRFDIDSSGNIGIGTTSPGALLAVNGESFFASKITIKGNTVGTLGNSSGLQLYQDASTDTSYIYNYYAGSMIFGTNNVERMRILSGGNVGIGTSSPAYKLDVNGTFRSTGDLWTNGNIVISRAGAYLYINGTNSDAEIVWQTNGGNRWAAGMNVGDATENFNIYNYTTATTNFTILKANGNVGIGSAAPAYKLDVNGTFNATGTSTLAAVSITGTINSSATEAIRINNNNGFISFYNSAGTTRTGYLQGNSGNSLILAAENSAPILFSVGGSEVARITTNGNVGIGTSSPGYLFTVKGGAAKIIGSSDNNSGIYLSSTATDRPVVSFRVSDDSERAKIEINNINNSNGDRLGFFVYSGIGLNERMSILGNGNVGIGTSSPISKLNAYASGSNLSVLKIDGGNGTLFEVTDQLSGSLFSVNTIAGLPVMEAFSNNRVVMGKYNANDFVISGSKIGIGTSSPVAKLSVYATSPHASPTGISVAAGAGGANLLARDSSNCHNWFPYTDGFNYYSADSHIFRSSNLLTNYVYINSSGNVGIGTSSPTATLDVSKMEYPSLGGILASFTAGTQTPTTEKYVYLKQTYTGAAYDSPMLVFRANANSANSGSFGTVRTTSNGSIVFSNVNATSGTVTSVSEKMRIDANGNIGIGTTSPASKLHIDDATAPWITISRSGTPTWQLRNNFPSNQYGFSFNNTTAGTVPLFIGAGGNIGIGLDSPGAKLDIASTQANGIVMRFDTSTNYNAWIRPYWNSNTDTRIDFAINRSSGVTPDVIMSVGYGTNVGIGTTAPVAKLHTVTTTAGSTVIRADGTSGTLFSVVDDLSDSLMSVNNSAGLPVLEVFADDRIVAGQYGVNDFVVINNKVGIGTNNPLGKLHVSGSNATSIIDGLRIGRGPGNVVSNTVVGNGALNANTIGTNNSAFGYRALYNNTEQTGNNAFGYLSLYSNIGYNNNAFGRKSLYSNTIGQGNNAFGYQSLKNNTTGEWNCAVGYHSLVNNTSGISNNAFGGFALENNTSGFHNNAFGYLALPSNTTGNRNNAFGYRSLFRNVTGLNNCAFGHHALYNNTTNNNNAFGYQALYTSTTGSRNSAFGHMALRNSNTASDNTAFGYKTLLSGSHGQFSQRNTAMGSRASEAGGGVNNSAFGFEALRYSGFNANSAFGAYTLRNQRTTGTANSNSAFGYKALINNISGYTNSAFGANAGTTVTGGINLTILGYLAEPSSATASNQITLGNSSVTSLRCQVTTITALSDFRDKTDINDIQIGLSFVEKLRPVTFKWDRREWYTDGNRDGSKKDSVIQTGFIAQELKALQEEEGVEFLKLVYEDNPDKLEATPGNLMIPLIKAVQELSAKVKTLEAKVQILESK